MFGINFEIFVGKESTHNIIFIIQDVLKELWSFLWSMFCGSTQNLVCNMTNHIPI